ncbi:ABC transporter ATP-binding protein [Amycolatopsis suaedae]|uniref:ABC transporter ATP-binding protein n=1 Tax=Amycolatopsis suaedae TaxID=2510978 RepID=A0A4Q7J319_9PSEU|nr:ABC transporter ATP-binding protein [Amycolatopsis suaedae]RZQ61871.1 ABC transporter ATP-binding protein [Amycolatopsis suaedae]
MALRLRDIRVELGGRQILAGASVLAAAGEVTGLVGPNGSGKSTLLRTVYRHLRPASGQVLLDEVDVWDLRPREAARDIASVPQETRAEFDITAREMVAMGRTPHKHPFAAATARDAEIVREALERVDALPLAGRHYATLSGGERQRVLLARALAQQTRVLVLDEPTNHLDARHQLDLMRLVRDLGMTTVMAVHDLNLAATYCDRLHVLRAGEVVASGPPEDVLTPGLLRSVFEVDADVIPHPRTGRPHLILSSLSTVEGGEPA